MHSDPTSNFPASALVVSRFDLTDRSAWSGIMHKIYEVVTKEFAEIVPCDRLGYPQGILIGAENRLLEMLGRSPYWRAATAKYYARQIQQRLAAIKTDWDVAIVIDSFMVLPFLKLNKPVIYLSDCTKTQLVDLRYPGFDHVSAANHRRLMEMERLAYHNATALVFCSQWAAESAIRQYGIPAEKVMVVPFGANIDHIPARDSAHLDGPWHHTDQCELLMIGVDWTRKGGNIAKEIMEDLNRRGIACRLTVCGCVPPYPPDPNIRVFPFLDKNKPSDLLRLEELLAEASYLVVPTQAECYGIVFCEAFAYGLPAVTCRVGGVPEIVTHGVNGFVLAPNAPAADFANLIAGNYQDQQTYLGFRKAARDAYEKTFNWTQWVQAMRAIAQGLANS